MVPPAKSTKIFLIATSIAVIGATFAIFCIKDGNVGDNIDLAAMSLCRSAAMNARADIVEENLATCKNPYYYSDMLVSLAIAYDTAGAGAKRNETLLKIKNPELIDKFFYLKALSSINRDDFKNPRESYLKHNSEISCVKRSSYRAALFYALGSRLANTMPAAPESKTLIDEAFKLLNAEKSAVGRTKLSKFIAENAISAERPEDLISALLYMPFCADRTYLIYEGGANRKFRAAYTAYLGKMAKTKSLDDISIRNSIWQFSAANEALVNDNENDFLTNTLRQRSSLGFNSKVKDYKKYFYPLAAYHEYLTGDSSRAAFYLDTASSQETIAEMFNNYENYILYIAEIMVRCKMRKEALDMLKSAPTLSIYARLLRISMDSLAKDPKFLDTLNTALKDIRSAN